MTVAPGGREVPMGTGEVTLGGGDMSALSSGSVADALRTGTTSGGWRLVLVLCVCDCSTRSLLLVEGG